jgi:hypothetical protein
VLEEFVHAYMILDRHRTWGMEKNPIQLSEIVAYCRLFGPPAMDMQMFEQLVAVMEELDREQKE